MTRARNILVLVCLCAAFAGCNTLDVYEQIHSFSTHEWKSADKPSFTFTITDTTSRYDIYVILRHEDAYHFKNIWLNVSTIAPKDTLKTQLINVPLADNKKGWLAAGMDDIYDHRARITAAPVALRKGDYTFTLQQNMREEPLQYVLAAGIRVEKSKR